MRAFFKITDAWGVSSTDAATLLGVSAKTVSRWESKVANLSRDTRERSGCELLRDAWSFVVNRCQTSVYQNATQWAQRVGILSSDEDVSNTFGHG